MNQNETKNTVSVTGHQVLTIFNSEGPLSDQILLNLREYSYLYLYNSLHSHILGYNNCQGRNEIGLLRDYDLLRQASIPLLLQKEPYQHRKRFAHQCSSQHEAPLFLHVYRKYPLRNPLCLEGNPPLTTPPTVH